MSKRYMEMVTLASRLDKAYGQSNYDLLLADVKRQGFKVMRNSKGQHKLEDLKENLNIFGDLFGGLF